MSISQAVYEAQIEQIADLQARLADKEAMLEVAQGIATAALNTREQDKARLADLQAQRAEADRLVLQLPCTCLNLGDGEYIECDRCLFLHGTTVRETDANG